jgi:phosphopentomutase
LNIPNLVKLGIGNIDGQSFLGTVENPAGAVARLAERSMGKDTTIGHWEIAGIYSPRPLPTYPEGFPAEIISEFERLTGRGTLCNLPYSGTDVIRDFGEEHLKSGKLIVYTSADSVFQIAAHESLVSREELYRYCEIARDILQGEHGVGRVIARPFDGEYPFKRTSGRHDFSLTPPSLTAPDALMAKGYDTISVGKIYDIFAGRGFTESHPTVNNDDGCNKSLDIMKRDFNGLCFINLVDFDMVYGHRNNLEGYAKAMTAFDEKLGEMLPLLREDDLLIITADHGCDPSTSSTDHSREYTPMVAYGNGIKGGVNLGTRDSFADIGATVLEWFGESAEIYGKSFLKEVTK